MLLNLNEEALQSGEGGERLQHSGDVVGGAFDTVRCSSDVCQEDVEAREGGEVGYAVDGAADAGDRNPACVGTIAKHQIKLGKLRDAADAIAQLLKAGCAGGGDGEGEGAEGRLEGSAGHDVGDVCGAEQGAAMIEHEGGKAGYGSGWKGLAGGCEGLLFDAATACIDRYMLQGGEGAVQAAA